MVVEEIAGMVEEEDRLVGLVIVNPCSEDLDPSAPVPHLLCLATLIVVILRAGPIGLRHERFKDLNINYAAQGMSLLETSSFVDVFFSLGGGGGGTASSNPHTPPPPPPPPSLCMYVKIFLLRGLLVEQYEYCMEWLRSY